MVFLTGDLFGHVRRYGVEFHRRESFDRAKRLLTLPLAREDGTEVVLDVRDLHTAASSTPLTFTLRGGDRVVITGPSGSGKTTLLETLVGWREPLSGQVRRGVESVAYVHVNSALLEGTIRENVAVGTELDEATMVDMLTRLSTEDSRLRILSTPVGPNGDGLSSGERVRLALARALLHRPRLVVLDDISGVLDSDHRARVANELARWTDVAVIEAAVSDTLLLGVTARMELP